LTERDRQIAQAKRLVAWREHLGLTRPEVARRLGISRVSVWRIETARQGISAVELDRWLADGLGITLLAFHSATPASKAEAAG